MSSVVSLADPAGAAPGRAPWPIRSGAVPTLADDFSARWESGPDLEAALPSGATIALVSDRSAGQATLNGSPAHHALPDWLRSTGKTQLAAAFAESLWHSRRVDLLVWIQATSRASVLSGYAAATADVTGRDQASSGESVAAQFLGWLKETSRSWLVVLDDLADHADLDGLWPSGASGRVLVTAADAAAVPTGTQVLRLGRFSLRESVTYLSERLSADPDKRQGAIELAHELEFQPVALAQAGAVIANFPLSCREYRDLFVRRRQQLAQPLGTRPPAAAVAWTLSLGWADRLVPGGSVQSLLAMAALLDGHGIPAQVFASPAAGAFLARGGTPAGDEEARSALAALEQVGLLTVEPMTASPLVRISPVLQTALRTAMPGQTREQAARSAADALVEAWPDPEEPGWPASGLRSCAAALRGLTGNLLWDGGCHPLLVRAGDSLDRARLIEPAVDHWRDVATSSGRLLGGEHPDTMHVVRRLTDAFLAAGLADDALPWLRWALDSLIHRLGPGRPEVIEAQRRLARGLLAAGQVPAALTVLEPVVPKLEQVRGPADGCTLDARDELAAANVTAGRYAEAIALYRHTLADRERSQGARHVQTMATRHGLAGACLASGRTKEAVALYKKVVADRERVLGPHHLDTLTARSGLGAAYQESGRSAAAELACEQAWAGFAQVLGPRHPDALRARAALAQVYRRLGRYGDARVLLRDTIDRLTLALPEGDPLIAELRQDLADIGNE